MSAEQNAANYRRFIDQAYNKGDIAVLDEIASPNLVLRFLPPTTPPGPESMKRHISSTRQSFPDVRVTIEELIAAGDTVVVRWKMTGTHSGPYINHLKNLMAPTGKSFSMQGIDIWHFDENGKWKDCWSAADRLGMLQQLGGLPAAGSSPS